jgi:hypothetical protein
MKRVLRTLPALAAGLAILGLAATVSAQDDSDDGKDLYDWPAKEAPVMVHDAGSVVFIGADREPYRAYSWDAADGDKIKSTFIMNLDNEDGDDVIGVGKPTFALKTNSDPMWNIEAGCDQLIIANFYEADDRLELMCRRGTTISILNDQKEKVWSTNMGVRMDWCRAGDINGDLKADLECKYRGREAYVRIDSSGEFITQESEETKLTDSDVSHPRPDPVDASGLLSGKDTVDLNGDGQRNETLNAKGSKLVFGSTAKKEPTATVDLGGKITTALVKNLDGEGTQEIVAIAGDKIVVLSGAGEKLGTYAADAREYRRYPVADLQSVYAQGFTDNAKAQKVVEEAKKKLGACYERRVRGNLFVRIGEVIMKPHVDADGDVTNVEKIHSGIRDKQVERCATNVLEDLDYPKASTEDGNDGKANVNIVMKFTFADKE